MKKLTMLINLYMMLINLQIENNEDFSVEGNSLKIAKNYQRKSKIQKRKRM